MKESANPSEPAGDADDQADVERGRDDGGRRGVATEEAWTTADQTRAAGRVVRSSREVKTNIDPVDPCEILDGVRELPVSTWEYEGIDGESTGVTHIGPMAEDFNATFDVGASDEHINSVNADGVALAAIKGLVAELDARDSRLDELAAAQDRRDERIDRLEETVNRLTKENERLRERLASIETEVSADSSTP